MRNEIRNELLLILGIEKAKEPEDRDAKLYQLLERFEYDIKDQLDEIKSKEEELKNNLETLEYVRKELNQK